MVFSLVTSFFAVISAQGLTVQSDPELRAEQLDVIPFTIQTSPGELSRHAEPTMDVLILAEETASENSQKETSPVARAQQPKITFQDFATAASIEFQNSIPRN